MICPTCGFENASNAAQCASCATPLPANIQTGHTEGSASGSGVYVPHLPKGVRLQGNGYAVGEVLGQGGFGITYKGGDLSLRRYVAIKEFFPQGCTRQGTTVAPGGSLSAADYAGVKAKFVEEARTLARFSDPGIVRVYGVFEENNTAYMVMEFLEGQTLSARIAAQGKLEESEVVSIAQKVGSALKAVHGSGLIHRDIKPDNICLTNDGRVVLIDFGTARAFVSGQTMQHTRLLTQGYAPLEQYGQQARFGAYTDIYALAATLYHALTGQVPPSAMDRMSGVELKLPHVLNPRLSLPVSQALMWAMQVKAPDRPQDIQAFLDALKFKPLTPNTAPLDSQPAPINPPPPASTGGWGAPQAGGAPPPVVPSSVAPPSQPSAEENWYHSLGGREVGPMSRATMQGLVRGGVIKPDTLIWRDGLSDWIPAGQSEWKTQLGATSYDVGDLTPHNGPRETGFDRFMMSIPSWVWSLLWITLFVVVAGRVGLGIMRYQNGSRDFGKELAVEVLQESEAAPLQSAELQLGEGELDPETLTKSYNKYVGSVRYKDGDAGTITLDVKTRDWLFRPEQFEFSYNPTDFGSEMSGEIQVDLNKNLSSLVTRVHLRRVTRTYYTGSYTIRGFDDRGRINSDVPGGSVEVTVTSFDSNGAPATWSYSYSGS